MRTYGLIQDILSAGGTILVKHLHGSECICIELSCLAAFDSTCVIRYGSPGNMLSTLFGLPRVTLKVLERSMLLQRFISFTNRCAGQVTCTSAHTIWLVHYAPEEVS
jgi:hypothetical protein